MWEPLIYTDRISTAAGLDEDRIRPQSGMDQTTGTNVAFHTQLRSLLSLKHYYAICMFVRAPSFGIMYGMLYGHVNDTEKHLLVPLAVQATHYLDLLSTL